MRPPPEGQQLRPDRKSVLFCPACGHESLVNGDWFIDEKSYEVRWKCPECRTTINSRPRFDDNEFNKTTSEQLLQDWSTSVGMYVTTVTMLEQLWLRFWENQLQLCSTPKNRPSS